GGTSASGRRLEGQTMQGTSRNLQVITGRAAREGARERVCFAQKPIAATKMAMWATQQPRRGDTTSCASRPSAGIDRAKCLISLKATGEQKPFLSTVGRGGARRLRPGAGLAIEMLFRARAPARNIRA